MAIERIFFLFFPCYFFFVPSPRIFFHFPVGAPLLLCGYMEIPLEKIKKKKNLCCCFVGDPDDVRLLQHILYILLNIPITNIIYCIYNISFGKCIHNITINNIINTKKQTFYKTIFLYAYCVLYL